MIDTSASIANWLQASTTAEPGLYQLEFDERHFGNPFVRSLHGGVTGAMIELSAQAETRKAVGDGARANVISNSIDYLRITKDRNLFARATIQRISRRLSVVDVKCWQDSEDVPVAQGIVTLRVISAEI